MMRDESFKAEMEARRAVAAARADRFETRADALERALAIKPARRKGGR